MARSSRMERNPCLDDFWTCSGQAAVEVTKSTKSGGWIEVVMWNYGNVFHRNRIWSFVECSFTHWWCDSRWLVFLNLNCKYSSWTVEGDGFEKTILKVHSPTKILRNVLYEARIGRTETAPQDQPVNLYLSHQNVCQMTKLNIFSRTTEEQGSVMRADIWTGGR